jgi:hypothetical protein
MIGNKAFAESHYREPLRAGTNDTGGQPGRLDQMAGLFILREWRGGVGVLREEEDWLERLVGLVDDGSNRRVLHSLWKNKKLVSEILSFLIYPICKTSSSPILTLPNLPIHGPPPATKKRKRKEKNDQSPPPPPLSRIFPPSRFNHPHLTNQ